MSNFDFSWEKLRAQSPQNEERVIEQGLDELVDSGDVFMKKTLQSTTLENWNLSRSNEFSTLHMLHRKLAKVNRVVEDADAVMPSRIDVGRYFLQACMDIGPLVTQALKTKRDSTSQFRVLKDFDTKLSLLQARLTHATRERGQTREAPQPQLPENSESEVYLLHTRLVRAGRERGPTATGARPKLLMLG